MFWTILDRVANFGILWEEFGGNVHVSLKHHRYTNLIHAIPPLSKLQFRVVWRPDYRMAPSLKKTLTDKTFFVCHMQSDEWTGTSLLGFSTWIWSSALFTC